jgi:hypothetical protein
MEVPIVYRIYADRFKELAIDGKILREAAKKVLTWRFRIPPCKVSLILNEMHKYNLIHMNGNQHINVKGCSTNPNSNRQSIAIEDFSQNLFR